MSKLSKRLPDDNVKLAQLVREFVQGLLARITWYHNIMAAIKDNLEREFYIAYHNLTKVQRTVAQIPWRSNLALLEKLEDLNAGVAVLAVTIKKNFEEVGI
jgi:hypothetical protein